MTESPNKLMSLEEVEAAYRRHATVGLDPRKAAIYKQLADVMRENEILQESLTHFKTIVDQQHKESGNG